MDNSILNLKGQTQQTGSTIEVIGGRTFSSILGYCSLIIVAPIFSFFLTKLVVLETVLGWPNSVATNVASAAVAVIVLHLGLGVFIYTAYFETEKKVKIGKQE